MPSIDELAAATGISDDDELPVLQSGTVRRATRAQIIAGTQTQLILSRGQILGRVSSGTGSPEAINIGDNLSLSDGVLSAPARYTLAELPPGQVITGGDLVPVVQDGADAAVIYAQFMAGLGTLSGFDLSQHRAAATGALNTRSFAALLADAATPEDFGAVGDGSTDDTAALAMAVATGRPVRLGPRTYALRGQWTITNATWLIGTPGLTKLARSTQSSGGSWISVQAALETYGVIFDATCPAASGTWAVLVTGDCPSSLWVDCQFIGAAGPLGCGVCVLPAADTSRHRFWRCEAFGNASHGIWVRSGTGTEIIGCVARGNSGYGFCLDDNDPQLAAQVKRARVFNCQAWGNTRGISVGNPNQTNAQPPLWGVLNPDAVGISIEGNQTWSNSECGIEACGDGLLVQGNRVDEAGTGLQIQASRSHIACNQVFSESFGIDLGGSDKVEVFGNQVFGARIGINPGGGQSIRVHSNHIAASEWAITAYAVETDGQGATLGLPADGLVIAENRLELGSGSGVLLADGISGVIVKGNQFTGNDVTRALVPRTTSFAIQDNSWDGQVFVPCAPTDEAGVLRVPDALDEVWVSATPAAISLVEGSASAALVGQVTWLDVTDGGRGYTQAVVSITGDGQGAQASALVRGGVVIGFRLTSGGSGYTNAQAVISGDGEGAEAVARIGLPAPDGRRLALRTEAPLRLPATGVPNWTGMDVWLPAGAVAELRGVRGKLQLVAFPEPALSYTGDGAASLMLPGDLYLRPGGTVHIASTAEPFGYSTLVGRGSPQGIVAAPPGSDYRNLDGGVGRTLWLKQSGIDGNGWAAIA